MYRYLIQSILVAAPNESQKTLKPEDHREWVVGNIEKLIFMGIYIAYR